MRVLAPQAVFVLQIVDGVCRGIDAQCFQSLRVGRQLRTVIGGHGIVIQLIDRRSRMSVGKIHKNLPPHESRALTDQMADLSDGCVSHRADIKTEQQCS